MTKRNINVVQKFVQGEWGYDGHSTSSENGCLYSYSAKIAVWEDGKIIVNDGWDGYSMTTTKHFRYLHDALVDSSVEWQATHEPVNKGRNKPRWY